MKVLWLVLLLSAVGFQNSHAEEGMVALDQSAQELNIDLDQPIDIEIADPTSIQAPEVSSDDPIEVTGGTVKMLGRGVLNRRTHETLALACVTENCSTLRMLYIAANGEKAYLMGPQIVVSEGQQDPSKKQIRTTLRSITRNFREVRREKTPAGVTELKIFGAFATTSGVAWVVGSGVLFAASGGVLFIPAAMAAAYLMMRFVVDPVTFGGTSPVTATFNEHDGWNWSQRPKRVSEKTFRFLMKSRGISRMP